MGALAAVLAGVVVAAEYLLACQPHLGTRPLDEVDEADDRRQPKGVGRAVEAAAVVLQDLRLATVDEHKGPTGIAYVQRLVVLI
jgi:hypothetical protein